MHAAPGPPVSLAPPAPSAWERQLASLVGSPTEVLDSEAPDGELAADSGIEVLRFLVTEFRAGLLARMLKLVTRLMLLYLGEARVRELFDRFFAAAPPELFAVSEAESFSRYVQDLDLGVPHLAAVISFELALQHACAQDIETTIEFEGDAEAILGSLARGVRRPPPEQARSEIVVAPDG